MTKTLVAAFAAITLIPTIAAADTETVRFTADGQTFVYTTNSRAALKVIDGRNETSGARFHLVVHGDTVSGDWDGHSVSFPVPARRDARPILTAAR